LGRFDDALKLASGNEKAYCLYKLKRYDEAVAASTSPLLRAQALFKLGRFKESAQVYEREGVENDEVASNLSAALLGYDPDVALTLLAERKGAQSDTYEFAFNGACAAIEKRDWRLASHLLATAHDTATTILEDFPEAEKATELSQIVVQQGYVAQCAGNRDEAVKCYLKVVDWKLADKTAVAVASSNLVGLQGQHGLFDSLKRLERAKQQETYEGLTEEQRESVSLSYAIVLMRLNRTDQCRKVTKTKA
jgi:tetratricopeptide (TPR) repeat protein